MPTTRSQAKNLLKSSLSPVATAATTSTRKKLVPTTPKRSKTTTPLLTPGSAKSNSSSSSRTELDPEIQRELCEDIESEGGIELFAGKDHRLASLLDKKVKNDPLKREIYGDSTTGAVDLRRRKVRRKVHHWKQLFGEGNYDKKVLARFGVIAHRHRGQLSAPKNTSPFSLEKSLATLSISRANDSQSSSQEESDNDSRDSSTDSTSLQGCESPTGSFFSLAPAAHQAQLPPRPPAARTEKDQQRTLFQAATTMSYYGEEFAADPTPIIVNTEIPWKNGPFVILPVKDVNPRWLTEPRAAEEEYFQAQVWEDKNGDTNQIVIKIPVGDYVALKDTTEQFSAPNVSIPQYLIDSLFNMQNVYEEMREENNRRDSFQHYVLQFPHHYKLSTSVLIPEDDQAGDAGVVRGREELQFTMQQIANNASHHTLNFQSTDTWIVWEVARVDVKAEKKAKREKKQSKGLVALQKMGKGEEGVTTRPVPLDRLHSMNDINALSLRPDVQLSLNSSSNAQRSGGLLLQDRTPYPAVQSNPPARFLTAHQQGVQEQVLPLQVSSSSSAKLDRKLSALHGEGIEIVREGEALLSTGQPDRATPPLLEPPAASNFKDNKDFQPCYVPTEITFNVAKQEEEQRDINMQNINIVDIDDFNAAEEQEDKHPVAATPLVSG
eukprot:scaffold4993_cov73-Cylindrotheca_fusiformis.AAC.2